MKISVQSCGQTGQNVPWSVTLHYICNYLIKWPKFKDHYGEAAKKQCLGTIAGINVFSVDE